MSKLKTTTRPPLKLMDFQKQRREAARHDTELVLQALLSKAIHGEVSDLALCYRDRQGVEQWVFTGVYHGGWAEVINAAARITWRLAERQEEAE